MTRSTVPAPRRRAGVGEGPGRGHDEEGYGTPPRARGLRSGYTTGACAAGAARAAVHQLVTGVRLDEVAVPLPTGVDAVFSVTGHEVGDGWARAVVVKDAGDDPDVTHGARLTVTASWTEGAGVEITGGVGVGTVTLPGLGLPTGGPAINPVPRRMLMDAAAAALAAADAAPRQRCGLRLAVSVPGGEEMARRTLNGRLGIVGGISILGTTGIVRAYSTESWRASVVQAVDVAVANGAADLVLSTGGRSERYARGRLPDLPAVAFVEMGEFAGDALDRARGRVDSLTLAGMIGKLTKLSQGQFQLHVGSGGVDPDHLAAIAARAGAPPQLVDRIRAATTARHAQEMALAAGLHGFFDVLCTAVAERCRERAGSATAVVAWCFEQDSGALLGSARVEAAA